MKKLFRFVPNFRIVRKVWREEGLLRIELGKWWEIRITVHMADDIMNRPVNMGVKRERIEFTKHIKDGGIIPFWYGFAHHDFDSDSASYMPIPINLAYASWRWFKYNILRKIKFEWPRRLMTWERGIYRLGQLNGYEAGRYNKETILGAKEILEGTGPHKNPLWDSQYRARP